MSMLTCAFESFSFGFETLNIIDFLFGFRSQSSPTRMPSLWAFFEAQLYLEWIHVDSKRYNLGTLLDLRFGSRLR